MRGTLDTLGLYDVPVGVGTDGGVNNTANHTATFVETAAHYMPGKNDKDKVWRGIEMGVVSEMSGMVGGGERMIVHP